MNTPRTALEECLRLAELATPPGEWKYSPWHVEEGPSAVLSTDGWAVCHTSSDTTAALIAAAINLLRTHGQALSEALVDAERYRAWKAASFVKGRYMFQVNDEMDVHTSDIDAYWDSEIDAALDKAKAELPPPPTSAKGEQS